jgi:hypothetical protein
MSTSLMNRDERLAYFRRALAEMAPVEDGFVVFEDAAVPDRVVQVAKAIPGEPPVIEATNVYDADGGPLTTDQAAALAALGFDITVQPFPQRAIDPTVPPVVADLVDAAFLALGAAADFTPNLIASEPDFPAAVN